MTVPDTKVGNPPTPKKITKALIAADNETRARVLTELIAALPNDDAVALTIVAHRAIMSRGAHAPPFRPTPQKEPADA